MKYKFTDIQLKGNKFVNDARALLDLLNEHEHTNIKMSFTKAVCGRAHPRRNNFTIPQHVFKHSEIYLFYYVIHEFTHCCHFIKHDDNFKTKERQLLQLFDISIEYKKAYPKTLYANGIKEWEAKS